MIPLPTARVHSSSCAIHLTMVKLILRELNSEKTHHSLSGFLVCCAELVPGRIRQGLTPRRGRSVWPGEHGEVAGSLLPAEAASLQINQLKVQVWV